MVMGMEMVMGMGMGMWTGTGMVMGTGMRMGMGMGWRLVVVRWHTFMNGYRLYSISTIHRLKMDGK